MKREITLSDLDVLPPVMVVAEDPLSAQFSQARIYRDGLRAMGQGAAVMAVLLGMELKRLHKLHGIKAGRPSVNSANVGGIKWEALVEREVEISETSARRYMDLAEQAKKRLPEFAPIAEELLNTPFGQLPDIRRAELAEKTRNLLPSDCAQQLAWDWGTAKRPGRKGGHHPGTGQGSGLSPEQGAELLAQDLFHGLALLLFRAGSEGDRERLFHLPITSPAPGVATGLADLRDHLASLLSLVESALEQKKKAVRKGAV